MNKFNHKVFSKRIAVTLLLRIKIQRQYKVNTNLNAIENLLENIENLFPPGRLVIDLIKERNSWQLSS